MNSELNNISNKGIENDNLIISNPELGDIMVNTTTGKISCEVLNDKENNMYKNFPVEYKMKDFEIPYPKEWNFEKSNDIIIENLKFVLNIKGKIKRVIIEKIWDWFVNNDYTIEELNQKFLKLEISVDLKLNADKNISFISSWEFVEEDSDINSGYADFYFDFETNEIKRADIGFY